MSDQIEVWNARAGVMHQRVTDVVDAAEAIVGDGVYQRSEIFDAVNRAAIARMASEIAEDETVSKDDAMTLVIRWLLDHIETGDADLSRLAVAFYDDLDDEQSVDDMVEKWDEGV